MYNFSKNYLFFDKWCIFNGAKKLNEIIARKSEHFHVPENDYNDNNASSIVTSLATALSRQNLYKIVSQLHHSAPFNHFIFRMILYWNLEPKRYDKNTGTSYLHSWQTFCQPTFDEKDLAYSMEIQRKENDPK